MNSYFQKISSNRNLYILFFACTMLSIAIVSSLIELYILKEMPSTTYWKKYNFVEKIFYLLLVYPIVATFLHQWLTYKVFGSFTESRIVLILISGIIYGVVNGAFLEKYITYTFQGVCLMSAFLYWPGKLMNKYFVTLFIQILYNGVLIFIQLLINRN